MSYQLGSVEPDQHDTGYAGERSPSRRALAAVLLAVAVMGLFAGGLWVAYKIGARHHGDGAVPLLRAEPGPTRIKPENPGGMAVPDQNMQIFKDAQPKVERLLPPPETPMPRPAPPPPAPPAPPAAAAAPAPPATAPPPAASAPTEIPSTPPSEAAAPEPPPPAPTAAAATRLQFGALKSREAAEQEWQHLKKANADLLAPIQTAIMRVDLGDKGTFWRIESTPFADPIAALQLCETLKDRKIGCAIAR